jgi:hypothetical protein
MVMVMVMVMLMVVRRMYVRNFTRSGKAVHTHT